MHIKKFQNWTQAIGRQCSGSMIEAAMHALHFFKPFSLPHPTPATQARASVHDMFVSFNSTAYHSCNPGPSHAPTVFAEMLSGAEALHCCRLQRSESAHCKTQT
eukprot:1158356-Pelagomonas_calceolata.AAC.7